MSLDSPSAPINDRNPGPQTEPSLLSSVLLERPGAALLQESLCATLRAIRGKRITLLRNRGNRGDGVIHMGCWRLLHGLGLEWENIYEPEAPASISADVLLVVGGGAFCRFTHSMIDVITRYAPSVEQVIIMPASFELTSAHVQTFVGGWDSKYTVFCRERRSFEALTAARTRCAEVFLSHDLAFYADLQPWAVRSHSGSVGVFRRDGEAVFDQRPLNLNGQDICRGPDSQPEALLDYVSRYAVVHADRLHAAITSAMMGREVFLYRNAYFKNQAIYEHSLSHLSNVHFLGKQPFSFRRFGAALYWQHVHRNAYRLRRRWREARQQRTTGGSKGSGTIA